VITVAGVPFELSFTGEATDWHASEDSLEITAAANTDWIHDPGGPTRMANVARLIGTPPPGDFQLSARVDVGLLATFDAGAIVLSVDEDHWAKLLLERSPAGRATVVTVVTRGLSDDCDSFPVADSHIWLRVSRLGPAYAFHASTDAAAWTFVRYFSLAGEHGDEQAPAAQLGFAAQSPTGEGCTARFSQIRWLAARLAEMRSGI